MSRWQTANVLQTTPGLSRLWRLNASGEEFVFDQEQSCLPSEPLNGAWIAKDFRSTFRHKLNLAWLPPDKAFLRVLHLPASEPSELIPMVEFQLEKLSPLPVAQIVWSVELLPRPAGKPDAMQTVVVVIASRAYVEEFLAGAEAKGFKTDALELPSLDQLLNTKIEGNGVWLYVGPGAEPALAAWWYGGELRHLALVPLAEGEDRKIETELKRRAFESDVRKREADARGAEADADLKEIKVLDARYELIRKLEASGLMLHRGEEGNLTIFPKPEGSPRLISKDLVPGSDSNS